MLQNVPARLQYDEPRLRIIDFGCGSRSAETSYYCFFLCYLTSAYNLLSNASWMSVCTHDWNCLVGVTHPPHLLRKPYKLVFEACFHMKSNAFVVVLHFSYMATTWQQPWICKCLRLGSRVKSMVIQPEKYGCVKRRNGEPDNTVTSCRALPICITFPVK